MHIVPFVRSPWVRERVAHAIGAAPISFDRSPSDVRTMLGTGNCHLIYEVGAWRPSIASDLLGTLMLSGGTRVFLVWRGDRESSGEAMRMAAAVPRASLSHESVDLESSLLGWLGAAPESDVVVQAIRLARDIAPGIRLDHCLVAALILGARRRSVDDLAKALAMSGRTLRRHCAVRGLPRPIRLLGWCRAVHVIAALDRAETIRSVADAGGDLSARDCADYVQYHTGHTPAHWHRNNGLRGLLSAFLPLLMPSGQPRVATTGMPA